jgi:hypothetical protein
MNYFGNGGNGLVAAILFRIKFRQNNGNVRLALRQIHDSHVVARGRNLTGFVRDGSVRGKAGRNHRLESLRKQTTDGLISAYIAKKIAAQRAQQR